MTPFCSPMRRSRGTRSVVLRDHRTPVEGVPDLPARIRALRQLGYRLAIDDLGAGYAGLTSFAVLAPDVVKLDMALVRDCDQEPVKQQLIRSMTQGRHQHLPGGEIEVVGGLVEDQDARRVQEHARDDQRRAPAMSRIPLRGEGRQLDI